MQQTSFVENAQEEMIILLKEIKSLHDLIQLELSNEEINYKRILTAKIKQLQLQIIIHTIIFPFNVREHRTIQRMQSDVIDLMYKIDKNILSAEKEDFKKLQDVFQGDIYEKKYTLTDNDEIEEVK